MIASYWDSNSYGAWRRRTQGPLRRRKRPDVREAIPYATLEQQVSDAGGRITAQAHSLRFVSQQSFFLAEKVGYAQQAQKSQHNDSQRSDLRS